ncbi:MAG: biopolymer transporter ExbD [Gemmobacter sp.]
MPRLAAPLRRRRLALTSLIDVIFLLLLFFMLSSTFTRFGDLPFMTATSGAVDVAAARPAFLRVTPDRLTLDTTEVAATDLPAVLTAQAVRVVIVAPSSETTAQRLVEVLGPLRGLPDIVLRVIGG